MSTINASTPTLPPVSAITDNKVPNAMAVSQPSSGTPVTNAPAQAATAVDNNSVQTTDRVNSQAANSNNAAQGTSQKPAGPDVYVDKLYTKHISQSQANDAFKKVNPIQKEALFERSIERLSSEISKNQKQISNTVSAFSVIQVANDSLDEIKGGLKELEKLAKDNGLPQAEDQTDEDYLEMKEKNQAQALDIVAGIQDLFESTKYSGEPLLTQNTNKTYASHNDTEYAVTITTHDVASKFEQAGLYSIDLNTPETIGSSLEAIHGSMNAIRDIQSQYTAQEEDFNGKMNKLFSTQEHLDSMHERITTSDFAVIMAEKAQEELLKDARSSILAQANADSNHALNLLTS